MENKPEITWLTESDKLQFNEAGIRDFDSFWFLEKSGAAAAHKPVRQHINRKNGEIKRQVTVILINGISYFVKRAAGKSYRCIVNEFEALKILPGFGLKTAELMAYGFDEHHQRAFLVFKNLSGYYSFEDLKKNNAPAEAVAEFNASKDGILKKLVCAVNRIHASDYFYPDWHAKHLFLRPGAEDIVLIDLERFLHLDKCPRYYRYPIVKYYVRRREWGKLRNALALKS
jgi:hypothetical protein